MASLRESAMKFGTARGITRSRVPLLAMLALAAGGIAGCSGDGASGGSGQVGPVGPTGPSGNGNTIAISQADTIIVTLASATVDAGSGKPTLTFTLMDGAGNGLAGLQAANVRFTAAKLIPGVNGSTSEWRSYISRVNNPDPAATPVPPALPASEQQPTEYATFETAVSGTACASTGGVFESLGGGNYRYTSRRASTPTQRIVRPVADAALRPAGAR